MRKVRSVVIGVGGPVDLREPKFCQTWTAGHGQPSSVCGFWGRHLATSTR